MGNTQYMVWRKKFLLFLFFSWQSILCDTYYAKTNQCFICISEAGSL